MPLHIWDLTGEFKGYLTPKHLRELNTGWRLQDGGCDDSVIETAITLISREDLHYENILGSLQTASNRRDEPFAKDYYELYQKMVEIISLLLYPRQSGSNNYIVQCLPPFEGLAEFVKKSSPVWAFSLNHDVMLQVIAQHCGIPVRDGFWPDKVLTISSNKPAGTKSFLLADVLCEEDLNNVRLHLFGPGEPGINLLRLHGALDIFSFRDGRDLCRLRPVSPGACPSFLWHLSMSMRISVTGIKGEKPA